MKKSKSPLRSMSRAVALEPRLLFDGAGAVAAADYVVDDQASAEQGQPQPVAEASAAHPVEGDAGAVALMDSSEGIEGVLPGSQTTRLELDDEADEGMPALDATGSVLLVVDSRVADYQSLLDDLPANVQVRIVEGDESGLDAVTEALASGASFDAIHIISHGTPGSLALGSDQFDASALDAHGSTLQGWVDYLSEDADILLYGCDLAQGDQGQAFIDELARLTGADIAASTNATGSEAKDGDWVLESATGNIEATALAALGYGELLGEGNIGKVENTADEPDVAVGEDDDPANILDAWKVMGTGEINVTLTPPANGQLVTPTGQHTFSGSATAVNAWLAGITYEYTGDKQDGDTDSIGLTFTTVDGKGNASQALTETQKILIAPQNDASVVGGAGTTIAEVNEGGELSFGVAVPTVDGLGFTHELLGISDPDNLPEQVIIKLESIPDPVYGSLQLTRNGQTMTLAVGSTLSVAELANLKYVATDKQVSPANGAATPLQSFRFTIDDGAGGRLTGQEVSIELLPVNQTPAVSGSVAIVEGESNVSLGAGGALQATRPDGSAVTIITDRGQLSGVDPDDSTLTYRITVLPEHGTLSYDGTLLTASNIGSTVISDLNLLTYSYPAGSEPSSHGGKDTFKISVTDGGGGTGTPSAPVENTVELTILENNDDPQLLTNVPQDYEALSDDGKVTDHTFTITPVMLGVTDPDSFDPNLVFKITGLSNDGDGRTGYFTVGGKLLNVGSTFTMQDVIDDKVQYHLRTTTVDERTDSFDFTVTDSDTGLLFDANGNAWQRDGGIYESDAPGAELTVHTFSVKVPASQPGGGGVLPDLPDTATEFDITNESMSGVLEGEGTATSSGDGKLLTPSMLSTDDGVNPPEKIVYRLETVPGGGALWLEVGTDWKQLNQFDSFTQKDINDGKIAYRHHGGEQFTDEFQFSISNGDITTDALSSFHISIVPQNDTPEASNPNVINLLEGTEVVINKDLTHIELSDRDRNDTAGGYANDNALHFLIENLPQYGMLYWVADPVSAPTTRVAITDANKGDYRVTEADLAAGKLVYVHAGDEQFTDAFTIRPYDDRSVAGSGITATNGSSEGGLTTISITVVPVNDKPALESDGKTHLTGDGALYEGETATIHGDPNKSGGANDGRLHYDDPDNDPIQIQYRITKATEYGQLYKGGVALKVGSAFTQADLDEGRISYRHNGGEGHNDSFEYLVSDGDYTVNDSGNNGPASVFEIQIKPRNDKPQVSGDSAPILVDGTNPAHNKVDGFDITDTDLLEVTDGEHDLITVIVRVVNEDGSVANVAGGYTLTVDAVGGVSGATSSGSYLQLTGKVADVKTALNTLGIGFASDTNAKYHLQVIVDDRLNPAGTDYQNGGAGVIANGGDVNHISAGETTVDSTHYDWADVATGALSSSPNLALFERGLWVSTINAPAVLTVDGPYVVNEDVPSKLTGISVADEESSAFGTAVEVTLNVNNGTLSAQKLPAGITVTGDGTGSITLRGSATALNAYLGSGDAGTGVFYTSDSNVNHDTNGVENGDVTLTVTLNEGASDFGAPADGGSAIGGDVGSGSVENTAVVETTHITITAINDAPSVTAPVGGALAVNNLNWLSSGTFTLADVDSAEGYVGGENDGTLQLTVRLLKADGTPLTTTEYQTLGVNIGSTTAGSLAVGSDGNLQALQIRGTLSELQNYLSGLQVQFTQAAEANVDGIFKLEVILDDRLRDASGTLIANAANGGVLNQSGTDAPVAISGAELGLYTQTRTALGVSNLAGATRDIFISALNDPGAITANNVTVAEGSATLVLNAGNANFVLNDSDHNGRTDMVTTVAVSKGMISAVGVHADLVTGVNSSTITINGATQAQINDILKALTITLPGTNATERADWNGSFDVTVVYDDKGNTGMRPGSLIGTKAGDDTDDPRNGAGDFAYADGDSGTGNALVTTRIITVTVTPVNDAPVVTGTGEAVLLPVSEDSNGSSTAQTVTELFGDRFQDSRDTVNNSGSSDGLTTGSSADSFHGVAVVGNTASAAQGVWQYSSDGSSWSDIPATVANNNVLILQADAQIRFNPAANFHGTPGDLNVRLVETYSNDTGTADTTSSTAVAQNPATGARFNLASNGGTGNTSLYSTGTIALTTTVANVNDAPSLTGSATLANAAEDSAASTPMSAAGIAGQLTYSDATDNRTGITGGGNAATPLSAIAITGNAADAATEGVWQYTLDGGSNWSNVPVDAANDNAIVLQTGNAQHQVRFVPVADFNGEPGKLSVRGADGTLSDSPSGEQDISAAIGTIHPWSADSGTVGIAIEPRNDAPTLTVGGETSGIEVSATESDTVTGSGNAFEVPLLESVTVADLDLGTTDALGNTVFGAGSITVALGSDRIAGDLLAVDGSTSGIGSVTAYDPASGRLVINLQAGTTIAQVEAILGAIQYAHQSDDPTAIKSATPRTGVNFSVTLNDGNNAQAGGNAGGPVGLEATVTGRITIVAVNDPPVAVDDNNRILENATVPVTGNVITGTSSAGTGSTPDSDPDTPAAELKVTDIVGEEGTKPVADGSSTVIEGKHGTLTIEADGNYSYVPHPGLEVADGDTLTEEFTYTLSDGDESDTAKLIITIEGVDDGVTVSVPNETTATSPDGEVTDHVVFESGLANGSSPNADDLKVDSSFTIEALDGLGGVTIGYTDSNGDPQTRVLNKAEVEALGTANQTITTQYGTLVLDGYTRETDGTLTLGYTYTLTSAPEVAGGDTRDSFSISATDRDGDSDGPATLNIKIVDDAPVASADVNSVSEGATASASGNVLTGTGVGNAGADVQGADGAVVQGVATGTQAGPVTGSVGSGLKGDYGTLTLNADGSYSYALDNANLDVQGLILGESLTETFSYTIVDADGDTSTTTLTITIDGENDEVTVTVPENHPATPPSGDVTDQVVFESGLADGSNPDANDIKVDSSFTVKALDGLGNVTIGYTDSNGDPQMRGLSKAEVEALGTANQTITTQYGSLVLDGYTREADGTLTLGYTYTLTSAPGVAGGDTLDSFSISATDRDDGSAGPVTLNIKIVDDAPVASADVNSVSEGATASASGNVLTGTGVGNAGADVQGADGAVVQGVATGTQAGPVTGSVGSGLKGDYGTLTLNADGSYSYALDNANLDVQGLILGESLTETFSYTIVDADGDTSTTTLTITIDGENDGVTVNVPNDITATSPDGDVTDHVVFESGLANGSSPNADDLKVDSSFTIEALDGLGSVTIGYTDSNGDPQTRVLNKAEVEALGTANQTITTQYGTLVLDGYTRETDGTLTIDYTYTLTSAPEVAGGDTRDSFSISATDRDGDSAGPATLNIKIVDDAPVAENDAATVDNATNTVTSNALTGTATGVGADSKGADDATITAISSNGVPGTATDNGTRLTIEGEHGSLVIDKTTGEFIYTRDSGGPLEATEVFTYTLTDGDGDFDTATITITIDDKEPVVTDGSGNPPTPEPLDPADPTRLVVKPDGSVNEAGLPEGSNPGNGTTTTTTGSITFTPGDGSHIVTVGGTPITGTGQTISTPSGEVTITEYDPSTGQIGYEYELKTPTSGDSTTDEFTVSITDADGDATTVTVVVDIVDDVPVAVNDAETVDNATNTASGNAVIGTATGVGRDTKGADGASITAISSNGAPGTATDNGTTLTIEGEHGTLVIDKTTGEFTYTRDSGGPLEATEVFTYTLTDGDGDFDTAAITITIDDKEPVVTDGSGNPPTPEPLDPADPTRLVVKPDGSVNEAGLPEGSDPGNGTTTTGSITFTPGDGSHTVTVEDIEVTGIVGQKITTPQGEVTITEYDPATGRIGYEYELKTPTSGDDTTDEFEVVITDADGDHTSVTVVIDIVDDVPQAADDAFSTREDVPVSGSLTGNDVSSADGGNVWALQTPPGNGSVTINPDGTFTYTPRQGFYGSDSFTYTVTDADGSTSSATVVIEVVANDPPRLPPATPWAPTEPGVPSTSTPSGSASPAPWKRDQVTDPSVFFYGDMRYPITNLPLPMHPALFVNNEVNQAQREREASDLRATGNPAMGMPANMQLTSRTLGLGFVPDQFVLSEVNNSQALSQRLASLIESRYQRLSLGGDGLLGTPELSQPDPDMLLSPLAEPQSDATEAPSRASLPRSAPSFTEQLRGGGIRLPLAARETLESRS